MKKCIVNSLTLLRILSSVLFGYLVLAGPKEFWVPLLAFLTLIIVYVSDFFDGRLARKWNAATARGAVFDVTADMFFVGVSFASLTLQGIFPVWISCVAAVKFVEFGITSYILTNGRQDSIENEKNMNLPCDRQKCQQNEASRPALVFDTLGKTSAVLLMALPLPSMIVHEYFPEAKGRVLISAVAILITIIAAASFIHRIRKVADLRCKAAKIA